MRRDLRALRPGQLGDADVQRLVDAFRPVAAAARFQLQQVGVEVLDVGGELEDLGDVFVADIAIGDEAHADFGVRDCASTMVVAIDQILRLAPSISGPIEPVVSSTKATSTIGLGGRRRGRSERSEQAGQRTRQPARDCAIMDSPLE